MTRQRFWGLGFIFATLFTTVCGVFLSANQEQLPQDHTEDTLKQLKLLDNEHPLAPVVRWAEKERPRIAGIQDYTAQMTKRENIDGIIGEPQVMEIKVRHEPFSVYLKTRFPARLNGQEAIFVRGRNDGKLIGHGAGIEKNFGTQRIDPEGVIAMRGNKYPITEMGVLNLIDRLLEVGRKDIQFGECNVKYYAEGVKVGQRKCVLIEVTHPVPRKNFRFHIARIFVDTEMKLPIRYESHDWPTEEGDKPVLLEEYTYESIRLNVGLTDKDFDPRNPAYNYPAHEHKTSVKE